MIRCGKTNPHPGRKTMKEPVTIGELLIQASRGELERPKELTEEEELQALGKVLAYFFQIAVEMFTPQEEVDKRTYH